MRVSKTVKDYIEKQVNAKLEVKYAPLAAQERATSDLILQMREEIISSMACLAEEIIGQYLATNSSIRRTNADIEEYLRFHAPRFVEPIPAPAGYAATQKRNEANTIVENIIVTLELGGTKVDLERMLNEI